MVRSFYTDTVIRVRAPLRTSSHGNETRNWAAATETALTGVRVQATTTSEEGGRVIIQHRLLGPIDLDITEDDRIRWASPRGGDDHEARIRGLERLVWIAAGVATISGAGIGQALRAFIP